MAKPKKGGAKRPKTASTAKTPAAKASKRKTSAKKAGAAKAATGSKGAAAARRATTPAGPSFEWNADASYYGNVKLARLFGAIIEHLVARPARSSLAEIASAVDAPEEVTLVVLRRLGGPGAIVDEGPAAGPEGPADRRFATRSLLDSPVAALAARAYTLTDDGRRLPLSNLDGLNREKEIIRHMRAHDVAHTAQRLHDDGVPFTVNQITTALENLEMMGWVA